jgi:hypothetical protein
MKDNRVGDKICSKNPHCPECKQYYLRIIQIPQPPFNIWWCKLCESMFEVKR